MTAAVALFVLLTSLLGFGLAGYYLTLSLVEAIFKPGQYDSSPPKVRVVPPMDPIQQQAEEEADAFYESLFKSEK